MKSTCPLCKQQFDYSPIYHGQGPSDYGEYSCYDCLSDRDKAAYDAFFRATEAASALPKKRIQIQTDRIYHAPDSLIEQHKNGEVEFACGDVILQPCFVGRGGDTFHVKFNWA